jgi:plastocyanin
MNFKSLLMIATLIMLAAPAFAKNYTVQMITAHDAEQEYRFEPDKLAVQLSDTVTFVNAQKDKHDVMFVTVPQGAEMAMSPMLKQKGESWSYTLTVFSLTEHVKFGIGGLGSIYALPDSLDDAYGRDPASAMIFARIKLK